MLSTRRLLLVALAAPLTLVACGGGGDDDEIVVPEGTHRGYALRDGVYVDAHAMARLHPDAPRIAPFEESA